MNDPERTFIKPGTMPDKTPMRVRKPNGVRLAPEGEFVVLDSFWRRRIVDADVVVADAPADVAAAETSSRRKGA